MSITAQRTAPHHPTYPGRLIPRGGQLHVVRWIRADGRDVRQRFFRRRCDAERFAAKLAVRGKTPAIYETTTTWQPAATR